jgi:pimeloyl-ACP methyl ester carboxylesterase
VAEGEIDYARAADGLHIAYRTQGTGPIDILEIGGFGTLFPLDAAEEQPRWHRFEQRMHRFARLTKFDMRGVGYSDQFAKPLTIGDCMSDAIAVLDAAGIERAVVFASSFGGFAALELAARFPERVESLILANSGANFSEAVAAELVPEDRLNWDEVAEMRAAAANPEESDREASDIDVLAPSLADDADVRRWWSRCARRGAGPAVAAAVWDFVLGADVRETVPTISVPTLVIATTRNRFIDPEFSEWMAARIPGAELCMIPSVDHLIWAVPDDIVVDEIERYLTGSVTAGSHTHVMAAILFTDIVDSTAHNTARGDRAWLELLERHDDLAEREVTVRGGRVVKRMGDGLLAVFSLASAALDAATALHAHAADLGIRVRAGLHVAEVEQVGDDVLGLGVTIAARALGNAGGGEVLTTRAAVDMVAGSNRSFETRGHFTLKGVDGDWELFSVSNVMTEFS